VALDDAQRIIRRLRHGDDIFSVADALGVTPEDIVAVMRDPEGSDPLPVPSFGGGGGGGGTPPEGTTTLNLVNPPPEWDFTPGVVNTPDPTRTFIVNVVANVNTGPAAGTGINWAYLQAWYGGNLVAAFGTQEPDSSKSGTFTLVVPAGGFDFRLDTFLGGDGVANFGEIHVYELVTTVTGGDGGTPADPPPPWFAQGQAEVFSGSSLVMPAGYAPLRMSQRTGDMTAQTPIAGTCQITDPATEKLRITLQSLDVPYQGGCDLHVFNLTTGHGCRVFSNVSGVGGPDDPNVFSVVPLPLEFDANSAIAQDGDITAARAEFTVDPAAPGYLTTAAGVLLVTGLFSAQALPA
jgi:hypothetical protein